MTKSEFLAETMGWIYKIEEVRRNTAPILAYPQQLIVASSLRVPIIDYIQNNPKDPQTFQFEVAGEEVIQNIIGLVFVRIRFEIEG